MPTTKSRVPATPKSQSTGGWACRAEPALSFHPAEAHDGIAGSQADHNIPLAISDAERKLFAALFGGLIEQILAEAD
jgi:hypothetical protein